MENVKEDLKEQIRLAIKEIVQKYEQDTKTILELEGEYNLTDLGNAKRLALRFKDKLRYCHPWNKWLVWDGMRWKVDATAEVWRYAIKTIGYIYAEAEKIEDPEKRRKTGNHAVKSESGARIREMISLAKCLTGIPVQPEEFDKDPWLLNVLNGTVDLKTGERRDHSKEDLMTKLAPVNFDPAAKCPLWLKFLDKIMQGNPNLIQYLQRVAGYCLTGRVSEQKLFFGHGGGANGKSTFLNVLKNILGDYAIKADSELLIQKPPGAHTTALVDLKGARLAMTIEVEEGRHMAHARTKELTGGDTIAGRRMRQDNENFPPTHKIFLAANHKPIVNDTTYAFWRRIALIPFNYVFEKEEKKDDYHEILLEERDGILQELVKGCLEWQKQGLGEPKEVMDATKAYKTDMDILGEFLDDCCVTESTARVTNKALKEAYRNWCQKNGEKELSSKVLSSKLIEKGFKRKENMQVALSRGRGWEGLGIKVPDTDDTDK